MSEYVLSVLRELGDKVIFDRELVDRPMVFKDRLHAGEVLAELIGERSLKLDLLLAIPRGGVPVALMMARKLKVPFDLVICRKIQIPWNPEAGYGAVAPDGTVVLNDALVAYLGFTEETIREHVRRVLAEIRRRERVFRGGRPYPEVEGRAVAIVDDGIASGVTMLAAVRFLRRMRPSRIIIAAPTASPSALSLLAPEVDLIVCPNVRSDLLGFAVADAYELWYDLTDDEVVALLEQARREGLLASDRAR